MAWYGAVSWHSQYASDWTQHRQGHDWPPAGALRLTLLVGWLGCEAWILQPMVQLHAVPTCGACALHRQSASEPVDSVIMYDVCMPGRQLATPVHIMSCMRPATCYTVCKVLVLCPTFGMAAFLAVRCTLPRLQLSDRLEMPGRDVPLTWSARLQSSIELDSETPGVQREVGLIGH